MEVPILDVRSRREWRSWLAKNHASSAGVWLVYYKDHTGVKSIDYGDSVCEALCFGWVDSLIKRLDEERYARKFTPRKPTSNWSDSNRKRWAELQAAGLLAEAGLAAAPTENRYGPRPEIPEGVPAELEKALQANAKARKFFQTLAASHQRHYAGWIHLAKRPETREKRIRECVKLLAAGKKLGLK